MLYSQVCHGERAPNAAENSEPGENVSLCFTVGMCSRFNAPFLLEPTFWSWIVLDIFKGWFYWLLVNMESVPPFPFDFEMFSTNIQVGTGLLCWWVWDWRSCRTDVAETSCATSLNRPVVWRLTQQVQFLCRCIALSNCIRYSCASSCRSSA